MVAQQMTQRVTQIRWRLNHANPLVSSLSSPVLLGLRFALHCCEKGGGQLALFPHLEAGVAHFDVDDGEILQSK